MSVTLTETQQPKPRELVPLIRWYMRRAKIETDAALASNLLV